MSDIDQERADLHALVREAHEAIKDLNQATRQIDDRITRANQASVDLLRIIEEMETVAETMLSKDVGAVLEAAAERQIEAYNTAWYEAISKSENRIWQRFDKIFETLTAGLPNVPKFPSLADEITGEKP